MKMTRRTGLKTLALGAALTLGAAPAFAQTQVTFQHPIGIHSHYGAGTTAFKETFERMHDHLHRPDRQFRAGDPQPRRALPVP
jgi:hypothetical protein